MQIVITQLTLKETLLAQPNSYRMMRVSINHGEQGGVDIWEQISEQVRIIEHG